MDMNRDMLGWSLKETGLNVHVGWMEEEEEEVGIGNRET